MVQFYLPGFDLGEVEEIVDQNQEMLPGSVDPPQVGAIVEVAVLGDLFLEQLAVIDSGVERWRSS